MGMQVKQPAPCISGAAVRCRRPFAATRDRVHLYRTAETTGYLRELAAR